MKNHLALRELAVKTIAAILFVFVLSFNVNVSSENSNQLIPVISTEMLTASATPPPPPWQCWFSADYCCSKYLGGWTPCGPSGSICTGC
jgi:hypothetical protein